MATTRKRLHVESTQHNPDESQEILARLEHVDWHDVPDFPLPPQAVVEFSTLSRQPNVRINQLAGVVEAEPGLTAELLRSVNSSGRGLRAKVDSVTQAIALLGTTNCTSIFLTKALDHALKYFESPLLSNADARRESLERARFAREVSRRMGLDPVLSFTAASLQDILLPLLTQKFEAEYRQYLRADSYLDIAEFERVTFGWTHAEVTAKTLREWGFPESLILRVLLHHESPEELFISEDAGHVATPNAVAALLDDVLQQSPSGVLRLVDLQRFHPNMQLLEIAAAVDDECVRNRVPGLATLPLVGRLQNSMLEQVERRRRESIVAGRQFGNYVLERQLTQSTSGTIFQAKHIMLRRPAIIKFLRGDQFDATDVRQFEREVQVTSTLRHPHTVNIFDYGRTHDGVFYYAMELVNGITLDKLVRCPGPVPDGRVLKILLQVCGSLAEAHANGLVHRDIKPQNIMVSDGVGIGDHTTVLDFGLVTPQDCSAEAGIRGTPLFISPEAAALQPRIDGRSDLYSLAAVAFFLLTGKRIFEGTVNEVLRQHISATPPMISGLTPNPVAPALENLLMKALSKAARDRPSSAMEMLGQLAAIEPAQEWPVNDASQWWQEYGAIAIEMSPLAKVACEETVILS